MARGHPVPERLLDYASPRARIHALSGTLGTPFQMQNTFR